MIWYTHFRHAGSRRSSHARPIRGAMRPIITKQTSTDTDMVVFISDLHAPTLQSAIGLLPT